MSIIRTPKDLQDTLKWSQDGAPRLPRVLVGHYFEAGPRGKLDKQIIWHLDGGLEVVINNESLLKGADWDQACNEYNKHLKPIKKSNP